MSMFLSVTEAATVLSVSPRAVRARLARGELRGKKSNGQWQVYRDALPLTAEQHRALQARAGEIRSMVEASLPPQLAQTRGDRHRTLADLSAFRAAKAVLIALRQALAGEAPPSGTQAAADHLERALLILGRAWPVYHSRARLALLDDARAEVGAALASLLLAAPEPLPGATAAWLRTLEEQVLPPIAGMCRAAERRAQPDRRPSP